MATITEMTTRVLADIPESYETALAAFKTKVTSTVTDCFWTLVRECRWWWLFKGLTVPTAGSESVPTEINHLFYLLAMSHVFAMTGSPERSALFGQMYQATLNGMKEKHGRKA